MKCDSTIYRPKCQASCIDCEVLNKYGILRLNYGRRRIKKRRGEEGERHYDFRFDNDTV